MTKHQEYYYIKCGLCDTEYRSDVVAKEFVIFEDSNGGLVCFECKEAGRGYFGQVEEEDLSFNTQDMLE